MCLELAFVIVGVLEVRVSGLGFASTVVTKTVFVFAFLSLNRDFILHRGNVISVSSTEI